MSKMKRFAAITAALLICAGNMGYMPESTKSIGGFTANAAVNAKYFSVQKHILFDHQGNFDKP